MNGLLIEELAVGNAAQHGEVNHSLHFIDPTTGVHTQTVESYWNRVKTKLKCMKGCAAHQLASYLVEFMWRERHGKTAGEVLRNVMRDTYIHSIPCVKEGKRNFYTEPRAYICICGHI